MWNNQNIKQKRISEKMEELWITKQSYVSLGIFEPLR